MSSKQEAFNRERRDQYHHNNLSGQPGHDGDAAEILRYLSEVRDLPINPQDDEIMGQVVSTLTSTANLSADEVRAYEWYQEIILLLYLAMKPRTDGMHSGDRVWAHDDKTADIKPLSTEQRIQLEAAVGLNSKLALSRSEDFKAVEEATRNVSESFVHDDASQNNSSGGILGRLKR